MVDSSLRVLRPGPFTTIQDLGRRRRGHQGVARSGAFDRSSHRLANRLVGNHEGAASFEILLGPFEFESTVTAILAVTGTNADVTIANGSERRSAGVNGAFAVHAGDRVTVGMPSIGLRTYLSVRGGIEAEVVLGSRSYDSLGLIGPTPLQANDTFRTGDLAEGDAYFAPVPVRSVDSPFVDLRLGPRHDWLTADSLAQLGSLTWTIDAASNRTGVRFAGPVLERRTDELASEAMIPGAVQLPLSGLPIVLGPDGGTTGGYPVIGVIPQAGLDSLAQRRPGEPVRFRIIPADR